MTRILDDEAKLAYSTGALKSDMNTLIRKLVEIEKREKLRQENEGLTQEELQYAKDLQQEL